MTVLYSFTAVPFITGDTAIPETAITDYVTGLSCMLLATAGNALAWANPATQVIFALEVSYDGGATWLPGGSSAHAGSPGSQIAALEQFGGVYSYGAVPTHFRGTITVANGPLALTGTIASQ
jgi:hypothetical protein